MVTYKRLYLCSVDTTKYYIKFYTMTYKYTISDKGSDSRQSNSWELSLDYAKFLAIESGNAVTIKCNRGHFSESFIYSKESSSLIPA